MDLDAGERITLKAPYGYQTVRIGDKTIRIPNGSIGTVSAIKANGYWVKFDDAEGVLVDIPEHWISLN